MAGDFEEFISAMAGGRDGVRQGVSNNVNDIRKAIENKHLEGLVLGDVLVQVEGIDDSTTYAKSVNTTVFVRYLTDDERTKIMTSKDSGTGFYDDDCIVCPRVTGTCPPYHTVDSRAYKKAQ